MATRYEIQLGDEIIEFEGPDNMSEDQIVDVATKHLKAAKPGRQINVVYEPREPEPEADSSATGAFLRNLPHEAAFNWDDELVAAANAYIPGLAALDNLTGAGQDQELGDYEGNLTANRALREQDDLSHPVVSSAGRVAGVLSALPRAGAAALSRLPAVAERLAARPISAAVGLGGIGGGVSGAGAGEGDLRQQSAALGAGAGAVVGGAISGALALAPAVAQYAKIFFGRGSDKEAVAQITKALARDGYDVTSPSGVQALRQELQNVSGKPVALADIGAATRARTGVGLRAPSGVQQQSIDRVFERQAGQTQRLSQDVRQHVAPRTDVEALDEALVAQRAEQAKALRDRALYEEAPLPPPNQRPQIQDVPDGLEEGLMRQMGQEVEPSYRPLPMPVPEEQVGRQARMVDDEILNNVIRTPLGQRALNRALEVSRAEYAMRSAAGMPVEETPYIIDGANLDVRTLDLLKRHLDDEVSRLYKGRADPGSFAVGELNQVKELRNIIRERMREVVPGYGDYLDAYRGSSEMIDALSEGQKFGNTSPFTIASGQAERSQAGQELYRVGAARSLLDTMRNTRDNANPASRILNSEESRAQLAATGVDPTDLAALNRAVQLERRMNLLPQELTGSQTNQRQLAQADADAGAEFSLPFNVGSPVGWTGALIRNVLNRTSVNRNAAVNEEALPRLLETNPQAVQSIIDELEQRGNIAAARTLRLSLRQRQAGGLSGVMVGGPVALQEE